MSNHSSIRKVIATTVVSGVIALTWLAGGVASADGPSTQGTGGFPSQLTIARNAEKPADDGSTPTETLSFNFDKIPYYNRIAFNYSTAR
jgi:hypothetical protein